MVMRSMGAIFAFAFCLFVFSFASYVIYDSIMTG